MINNAAKLFKRTMQKIFFKKMNILSLTIALQHLLRYGRMNNSRYYYFILNIISRLVNVDNLL